MPEAKIDIPYLQKILDEIAQEQGFTKPRYEVSPGSQLGDNYVGLLYRIVLHDDGAQQNGHQNGHQNGGQNGRQPLSLIFKAMPQSAKRREALKINIFFQTEANMYNVVLPSYTKFMREKGIKSVGEVYPGTAKCYGARIGVGEEGEDVLILEDMKPKGFVMHDRKIGLDEAHCKLVLQELARLHATGMAMEQLRPEEFGRLKECVKENMFYHDNPIADQFSGMVERTYAFVEERYPQGSPGHAKLQAFLNNYFNTMCDLVQPDPEGGNVICHGDCWINNLLFKYSERTGLPEEVTFIDWQIAHYCSPVVDILYLIMLNTTREMREKHFQRLLTDYHDELTVYLQALGAKPNSYTWDTLQRQLKTYGKYGLGMACLGVPILVSDPGAAKDIDNCFENGDGLSEMLTPVECTDPKERDKRICDVVEECLTLGIL